MPVVRSPGTIVLFGSGETAAVGGEALRWLAAARHAPRGIAILETPAGFEPNAEAVAGRWTDFLRRQSETERAELVQVPARRRGGPFSPDEPNLARPLLGADLCVLGAGSPTYAVRQLDGSLAWRYARAAHLLGASFFLASAAAVAAGTLALPVYEIYKVGDDLHWKDGLGLLEAYGLTLAVVPHWDNLDGGAALDTSRCFMGKARFDHLEALLPAAVAVVGIDEHTALALDPGAGTAQVLGRGTVTVRRDGTPASFAAGSTIALTTLGPFGLPVIEEAVPADLARAIHAARSARDDPTPPAEVAALVALRERARAARDWAASDRLREQITERGWRVEDTPAGPRLLAPGRPASQRPSDDFAQDG